MSIHLKENTGQYKILMSIQAAIGQYHLYLMKVKLGTWLLEVVLHTPGGGLSRFPLTDGNKPNIHTGCFKKNS